MSLIVASEHVQCPPQDADTYLDYYLSNLMAGDGTFEFDLRVPAPAHLFEVEKRVVAKVAFVRDLGGRNQLIRLDWHAKGGGPFPVFEGTLSTTDDDAATGTVIALSGQYAAPGGAAGQLFDDALGYRIARASVRELLERVRDGMEAQFLGLQTRSAAL
ncbi:MAG TPA: hypothetical protein VKG44_10375 [Candidatus Baltobacteraceae bacterium]|nr:hypothetical protein [Candidatus Baltobacteraceae bacterium]